MYHFTKSDMTNIFLENINWCELFIELDYLNDYLCILFQLVELEGRNKEVSKERDAIIRELDKSQKDLVKAKKTEAGKTKKDTDKGKKDAKKVRNEAM